MDLYLQTPEDGYHFNGDSIKLIEEKYGAKYMGYWCTKRLGGSWHEVPVDVFYQPDPDTEKGHTHYFGVYRNDAGLVMITEASSAFSEPIAGSICDDGEVIVSRYRHDYVAMKGAMIDGGRDYVRTNRCKTAEVVVEGDKFVIKDLSLIS
jgi:hypothetical protein